MQSGGSFTLTNNVTAASNDAPLYVPAGKTVTLDLNGYTIDRALAEATANGYAILVNGSLTINDSSDPDTGVITGGFNSGNGGGVVVDYSGTFTMSGGTISGNSCGSDKHGGGVAVYGTFRISGSPVISGNMASKSGSTGNVYLNSGMVITVTDALDESASVGVSMKTSGTFTSGLSGNGDASNFTSDDSDYRVYLTATTACI